MKTPLRINWIAKWASHFGGAIWSTQCIQCALTAICHWPLKALDT
jgi:hypothetical protein